MTSQKFLSFANNMKRSIKSALSSGNVIIQNLRTLSLKKVALHTKQSLKQWQKSIAESVKEPAMLEAKNIALQKFQNVPKTFKKEYREAKNTLTIGLEGEKSFSAKAKLHTEFYLSVLRSVFMLVTLGLYHGSSFGVAYTWLHSVRGINTLLYKAEDSKQTDLIVQSGAPQPAEQDESESNEHSDSMSVNGDTPDERANEIQNETPASNTRSADLTTEDDVPGADNRSDLQASSTQSQIASRNLRSRYAPDELRQLFHNNPFLFRGGRYPGLRMRLSFDIHSPYGHTSMRPTNTTRSEIDSKEQAHEEQTHELIAENKKSGEFFSDSLVKGAIATAAVVTVGFGIFLRRK